MDGGGGAAEWAGMKGGGCGLGGEDRWRQGRQECHAELTISIGSNWFSERDSSRKWRKAQRVGDVAKLLLNPSASVSLRAAGIGRNARMPRCLAGLSSHCQRNLMGVTFTAWSSAGPSPILSRWAVTPQRAAA